MTDRMISILSIAINILEFKHLAATVGVFVRACKSIPLSWDLLMHLSRSPLPTAIIPISSLHSYFHHIRHLWMSLSMTMTQRPTFCLLVETATETRKTASKANERIQLKIKFKMKHTQIYTKWNELNRIESISNSCCSSSATDHE